MSTKNDVVIEKPSSSTGKDKTHDKPGSSTSKENMEQPSGSNKIPKDTGVITTPFSSSEIRKNLYLNYPGILNTLPSLLAPRDLAVANQNKKKVYAPNLNVKRNKNLNVKTSKDTTRVVQRGKVEKSERGARGGGRGGTRGGRGGRGGSNLIQTTGVFSEGVGTPVVKKTTSSRYPSDETSSTMTRPIITKSDKRMEIKTSTESPHVIDDKDDKDDEEDFFSDKINLDELPVILGKAHERRRKERLAQIQKDRVGSEHKKYPSNLKEMFESSEPITFLMQLPDALPFDPSELDDPTQKPQKEEEPKSALNITKPLPKAMSITRLEDGEVGKIVRYRSGKAKFVIGTNSFDIIMGMGTTVPQQLMSINIDKEQKKANVIQLGHVNAKITAVPDWKHMIRELDAKMNETSE